MRWWVRRFVVRGCHRENGIALVAALMAMMLMLALGSTLIMVTMTETQISGNHRDGIETLYAAEAGLDIALSDLRSAFWKDVLLGTSVSTFTDGPASGLRTLPDRTVIDLASDAPKGPSGRPWLLYAYGPLAGMLGIGGGDTPHYLTIWVTGDPMAAEEALVLRATAHGRGGSRRNVELTIRRSPVGDSAEKPPEIERVLWRER